MVCGLPAGVLAGRLGAEAEVEDEFVELATEFAGKATLAVVERCKCPGAAAGLPGLPHIKVMLGGGSGDVVDEQCLQATAMGAEDLRVIIEDACDSAGGKVVEIFT